MSFGARIKKSEAARNLVLIRGNSAAVRHDRDGNYFLLFFFFVVKSGAEKVLIRWSQHRQQPDVANLIARGAELLVENEVTSVFVVDQRPLQSRLASRDLLTRGAFRFFGATVCDGKQRPPTDAERSAVSYCDERERAEIDAKFNGVAPNFGDWAAIPGGKGQ